MRAKRSKDTPLMDKFSKRKEDLAAENKPQLVVASANNGDSTQGADEEEEDLKVKKHLIGQKKASMSIYSNNSDYRASCKQKSYLNLVNTVCLVSLCVIRNKCHV